MAAVDDPMPDHRQHRGAHPEDAALFAASEVPRLRAAVEHLSWLLTRGYAEPSSLKLVGDHHRLERRQRQAVARCACPDVAVARRRARNRRPAEAQGLELLVDGYNVLTTIETALGGGVVLLGRDGAARDVSGVHGTWRRVVETEPAIEAVGAVLAVLGVARCRWLLDAPVSNSGRLQAALRDVAARHGWRWQVELVPDPDPVLAACTGLVATADSAVLDRCARWLNLAAAVVGGLDGGAWVVDLA